MVRDSILIKLILRNTNSLVATSSLVKSVGIRWTGMASQTSLVHHLVGANLLTSPIGVVECQLGKRALHVVDGDGHSDHLRLCELTLELMRLVMQRVAESLLGTSLNLMLHLRLLLIPPLLRCSLHSVLEAGLKVT